MQFIRFAFLASSVVVFSILFVFGLQIMSFWARLSPTQRYLAVLCAASAARLSCFACTSLPVTLAARPELSTPLTAIRSLREGVFLYKRGIDPYAGGVFHHSPLYLELFRWLPLEPWCTALVWSSVDMIAAAALAGISCSRGHGAWLPVALFLFNPYTIMTCLATSTTAIDNALLLCAIWAACEGSAWSGSLLAISAHSAVYPALLLPSLAAMGGIRPTLVAFVATAAALSGLFYMLHGGRWIEATWGVILTVSELTPNVGMWWYFFTEMFDHFRSFFLGVFQLHHVVYVAPIVLRFKHNPSTGLLILTGVMSTWKSYPALGDMALWAGLLGCFPELVSNLRHPLFTLTVHLYTLILLPLLHSLWLLTGTGNANFFYAATMVYGLNASLAVVDVLGAAMRYKVKASVPWKTNMSVVQLTTVE